jgi:hemerythrin superfamily protein
MEGRKTMMQGTMTDPIEMLKEDHQKVKGLFQRFESTEDERQKQEIFEQIRMELEVHTALEEEHFYPACKEVEELKEMTLEAWEEHNIVGYIMGEMRKLKPSDESYDAKFTTLKENVEHHVEEEEGEFFPKAKRLLGDMTQLGQRMMEDKQRLMERAQSGGAARPRTRAAAGSSRARSTSGSRSGGSRGSTGTRSRSSSSTGTRASSASSRSSGGSTQSRSSSSGTRSRGTSGSSRSPGGRTSGGRTSR